MAKAKLGWQKASRSNLGTIHRYFHECQTVQGHSQSQTDLRELLFRDILPLGHYPTLANAGRLSS